MTTLVSSTGRRFIVIADSARGPAVGIVSLSRRLAHYPEQVDVGGAVYVRRLYERSAGGLPVYVRAPGATSAAPREL